MESRGKNQKSSFFQSQFEPRISRPWLKQVKKKSFFFFRELDLNNQP
jgi:hypothetical protein